MTVFDALAVRVLPVQLSLLELLILPEGHLPPLLLLSLLLGLAEINRLVVSTCKFILGFVFVLDGLVDSGVAGGAFDIDGVQTAHVGLVHGDSVFEGVSFWTLEDVVILDFRVVEPIDKVFASIVHEVVLSRGHLGGVVFGLAVEPGAIGYEVLLVERIGLVEGQLVVVHADNFIASFQTPTRLITPPYPYNFIAMANKLNGSTYYRANPYYQQGYIPDGAYKNRRPPLQLGEIPQGQQFFEPTNKKHFQRLGYYSTIAEQKIIHTDNPSSRGSPAKEKEYFRSLNINDIEGATTNTLISKAVKNRMKAQEELNRRAQQQRESQVIEKMRMLQRAQSDRRRMETVNIRNSNSQPNYHQKTKRLRTQEIQKMSPKPQNNAQIQPQLPHHPPGNDRIVEKDAIQSYREQLQQADREIQELELQLSHVKSQKDRAKYEYEERYRQSMPPGHQDLTRNIAPVTNEKSNQYYSPTRTNVQGGRIDNPEHNYSPSPNHKLQLSPEEIQYLANERERQQKHPQEYGGNAGESPYGARQGTGYGKVQRLEFSGQKGGSIMPLSGRQTREQHRRFNPTFLSYGSASIGLAGKNIVGY